MAELAQIEKVVFLQSADLFAFCKAEQVLRIAAISHERRYSAGETIFKINQPADVLHLVVQGSAEVTDSDGSTQVGPLQAFGVLDVLSGRLRTGDAVATTDTLLLTIDAEDFFDLLACNIEIVKAIFRQCVGAQR